MTVGDGSIQSTVQIKKADNNNSDHIQFYNGTTRVGEIGCEDTTWLRINDVTAKNIYTPRYIRADNGFFVDGATYGINGSGVVLSNTGATIGGNTAWHAGNDGSGSGLDADTLDGVNSGSFLRSDANDTFTGTTLSINAGSSSNYLEVKNGSDTDNYMRLYCESNTTRIADTFAGNTDKRYIYFSNPNGSNDPGYILHETRGSENNEGVLHLVPSDDNGEGDYVSIHGTNDADVLKLHTSGLIETATNFTLNLKSAGGNNVQVNGNRILTTADEGSGNGLDADTLDGVQASALAPISSPTFTGDLTIPGAIIHSGDTNTYIQFNGNDLFRVVIAGAQVQQWGNNYTLLGDNDTLRLGTGSDFRMVFNGADTVFRNYAHANGDIIFQGENSSGTNQNIAIMKCDSTRNYVILYENSAERFRTTSAGVSITGALTATGDVTAISDINSKENIEVIPDALDKVSKIRGVTFTRKDLDDKSRKSGVIAQEVEKVLPEVVTTTEDGTKTVAYGNLVGLLIESIKELKEEVALLKEKCK